VIAVTENVGAARSTTRPAAQPENMDEEAISEALRLPHGYSAQNEAMHRPDGIHATEYHEPRRSEVDSTGSRR